jgi:hypothetical protein
MGEKKTPSSISRREFARRAALASAVVSFAPTSAVNAAVPAAAKQAQLPPNMPRLSPEGQTEADARLQSILAQYGTRFSEEQKADLQRLCILAQPPLDRLRAYNLENGDGPALYLKPLVEREKKPKAAAATKPGATSPTATASPAAKSPDAGKAPAPGASKPPAAGSAKTSAPAAGQPPAPPAEKKP